MEATPILGMRVQFADGSRGQIVALRRAFVDGDVRDQIVVGPEGGTQVLATDGELIPNWIDASSVALLIPIGADADATRLRSELVNAKLDLLRQQIDDRLLLVGDANTKADLALRALAELVPLITDLPVPPAFIDGLRRAAVAILQRVLP